MHFKNEPIIHSVDITDDELRAIFSIIGNSSISSRISMGVSRENSELLSRVYKDIDKYLGN